MTSDSGTSSTMRSGDSPAASADNALQPFSVGLDL